MKVNIKAKFLLEIYSLLASYCMSSISLIFLIFCNHFRFAFLHKCTMYYIVLVRLAEWVLQNNSCTFNGTTYLQIQGTAMDTPFAVVYVCIFLSSIEMEVFAKITNRLFSPLFYCDDWLSSLILPSQWN